MNHEVDERFDGPQLNLSAEMSAERWATCWLEDLLCTVHYNFQFGRVFYCVYCSKGLYQDKDFAEGAHHSGHRRLKMDNHQGGICVNQADIESHDVDTTEVQKFSYNDSYFIFLHNIFGYALTKAKPGQSCARCHTKLWDESDDNQIRFCSLECKFYAMVGCKQDSFSTRLNTRVQQTPPPRDLPTPGLTYAQVTKNGTTGNRESPGRILTEGNESGCNGQNVASIPHEISNSSNRSGAGVHEHSVQQVPDVREVDQISLPKALYEELEVRSFSPCEEVLSMNVKAEHRSYASSPESIFVAGLSSYADSKPVNIQPSSQTLHIPNPPESMVPTTPLFRTALAAASSSSIVDEWRLHQTTDFMNSDWDVEEDGMAQVEGLRLTPKALNDNLLKKAAHLLRIYVSQFENNHSVSDEDDTNSKEGSVLSEGTGSEISIASPKLESFNAEGLENRSHFAETASVNL